jgi:excisionase family DNA binding protein
VSTDRPPTLDEVVRQLLRGVVRDAVREELAPLLQRNAAPMVGADDGYLSVTKAARIADVAPGTIRAWIRAGRLTAQRAGRVLRISRRELAQFMAGAPTGPSGADVQRRAERIFAERRPLRSKAS